MGFTAGSTDYKISIQVTSEATSEKIKETLVKFVDHDLHLKYQEIYILFLVPKYNPSVKEETINNYLQKKLPSTKTITTKQLNFSISKNTFDVAGLIKKIKKNRTAKDLKIIKDHLESEFEYLKKETIIKSIDLNSINLNSLNNNLQGKNPFEALKSLISHFYPIRVLPTNIASKIFPFYTEGKANSYSYLSNFSLFTNNHNFFNFIKDLKKEKGKIIYKGSMLKISQDREWNQNINNILTFLSFNSMYTICLKESSQDNITIDKLLKQSLCLCEKCSFARLEINDNRN